MLRDITIGQYYPTDSWIHRLDPRVKIVSTFVFIIALFIANRYIGYALTFLFLACIIAISKVPVKFMLKGLKAIFVIILITVALNIFMTPGDTIIWQYKSLRITGEGLYLAGLMALRLIFLIIGSSILTLTTSPIQLTDGIESILKPFKKVGIPAHEIAMMMTIALRFIPILLEETDKIMKAQMARGADFESGGIVKRAKSLIPLLVPLFISAFRRADELAMAMEARCYRGGENRTRMKQLVIEKRDYVAMAVMIFFTSAMILIRFI
ncbi:MAG: energy-coupling factor transport system permease protein [Epulopiscium sp.]|jgi:energy-coupling factor transport system permease protein|uniref:Energy-coupling factor transporter transmembrane protein EcfT n=1 Tax=Defluviitalea raffinosedens TaxID=1450156 RepID=A0A7C8LHP3_9FIRM|nr:energy-coupling factor transporter transmembrane component T [Defluviitalea raffinosedens]MBZ4669107.1 ecfT [Defluviitaleaceae bacterium]MDK2788626.1 energy-coupling factor transport system permease protein [Candidatus Epulonipiscium sp.]KAE9635524.1 energy-coupling factor transporter transmembrane protein EcfT [Defluviitalea raffinosedens]MBM7684437.1 energy-coupling factor transport system permease protein [Defluviitalea raffinosedens]HHW68457.1 energy-coupling factor transporter transmem